MSTISTFRPILDIPQILPYHDPVPLLASAEVVLPEYLHWEEVNGFEASEL